MKLTDLTTVTLGLSGRLLRMLSVIPARSLLEEEVRVVSVGLKPRAPVRLETRLVEREQGFDFKSVCDFETDDCGVFSTDTVSPLAGDYQGVHTSGPLWSVRPSPGSRTRLWPDHISKSLQYELSLSCRRSGEVICTAAAEKYFLSGGVRRLEVREGRVRGVLFLPPSPTPAPAIITIYGGVNKGKVPEDRAAVLASHGFVTLALAFYGVDGLPPLIEKFDMNYFEQAVDYLLSLPEVSGDKVGVFGSSTGGSLALTMMSCMGDKISACVVSAALYGSFVLETQYKGEIIIEKTDVKYEGGELRLTGSLEEILRNEKQQIKIENCPAPLLVIEGEEDTLYRDARGILPRMIERAEAAGKSNVKILRYPGAGHLIDLPHSPFSSMHRHILVPQNMKINYGGHPQLHSLAQIQAWDNTLRFFKDNLQISPPSSSD